GPGPWRLPRRCLGWPRLPARPSQSASRVRPRQLLYSFSDLPVILARRPGEVLCQAGEKGPHLQQFFVAEAAADALVLLRRGAAEPMKLRNTGRREARDLHPTIVRRPLAQNEALIGHGIEVMGERRPLHPDALGEFAVAEHSLAHERHQDQPHRQRPACSCERVIEASAEPLGGLAEEQSYRGFWRRSHFQHIDIELFDVYTFVKPC